MAQLVKLTHTIDEMLEDMGVKIVLDGDGLTEKERLEAEENGAVVEVSGKEKKQDV